MRLRTSSRDGPGYRRIRCGRGFRYADTAGRPLTDPAELARIRALTIPPAWRDVWICPRPGGHLQAVGTDDAGRRQYLYHEQFRAEQEKAKHEHVRQARTLPELRGKVAADLTGRGLTPSRVTACAVRLLHLGFFRIGSDRPRAAGRRSAPSSTTRSASSRGRCCGALTAATGSSPPTRAVSGTTCTATTSRRRSAGCPAPMSPPRTSAPGTPPCSPPWRSP